MHSTDLILTLAGGLGAALVLGYLTQRAGLSPILGYLFAGLLVGPYTPGFVADQQLAEQLAEVGVILLMFGVGLQFHIEELLAVRRIAIPGAVAQSVAATLLGAAVAQLYGWPLASSVVFGLALSVASTVVLIRVLTDNNDLNTTTGHIAVGWLVVEDIFTVVVLVMMPPLFGGGATGWGVVVAVVAALLKIGLLAVFAIVAGGRAIPWLLDQVAVTRSRELFTLTVLVVALGIAVAAAKLFGVSMALGAFLAGMVVGRSEYSVRAAADALPMRDAFAVLFFVSVGMLLDPEHLLRYPGLIALTVAVIVIGKPLAALAITSLFRYPLEVGLGISIALAQIGEFSFIVATLGNQLGVLPREATQTLVAAAIMSITLNPLLYRSIALVGRWRTGRGFAAFPGNVPEDHGELAKGRPLAIVIGYGPIGRIVVRLLEENGVQPSVIELNILTVRQLTARGTSAIYGDASHPSTLEKAGIARARAMVLTVAGLPAVKEVIRLAKEHNPEVKILARAAHLREAAAIRAAGADDIFSGESEVALAFAEAILQNLGATPDDIVRERARVHAELSSLPHSSH